MASRSLDQIMPGGEDACALHHWFPTGTFRTSLQLSAGEGGLEMNQLIYLIGLIVVILAILSFFGLR